MKIELTSDATRWVETELAAGHFSTAEEAVHYAINQARLSMLLHEESYGQFTETEKELSPVGMEKVKEALEDYEAGKVSRFESTEDLIKDLTA